jgi:hypothetical protein
LTVKFAEQMKTKSTAFVTKSAQREWRESLGPLTIAEQLERYHILVVLGNLCVVKLDKYKMEACVMTHPKNKDGLYWQVLGVRTVLLVRGILVLPVNVTHSIEVPAVSRFPKG